METQKLHRGRLIDHIQIVTQDLERMKRFYRPVLQVLGIPFGGESADYFWADELFISSRESFASARKLTGRMHFAFQAKDRETVDRFYAVGLASGGHDNGKPGERPYHPGYYAGFVVDPDGNNLEAVFHGPARKSAESIEIEFDGADLAGSHA